MALPAEACCPTHRSPLMSGELGADRPGEVRGSCGCVFPVVRGIPRFIDSANYADAFGLQWNAFARTQLDSHTGTTISRDRLARCLGGSLDGLQGSKVLEVGCGAGRFTEILLAAGAHVFACDLSSAVDANYANCRGTPRYFVCQADVMALPIPSRTFDVVVALGMIQHTPNPEATIAALAEAVRPGGLLVIDHYRTPGRLIRVLYPLSPRAILRRLFLRLSPQAAFRASDATVRALLPVHRMLWRRGVVIDSVRRAWRLLSPVFDYYDAHPDLKEHLEEWALLDTHDALTDRYKHLRTPAQIAKALTAAGVEVIESRAGGNGVEARARRPAEGDAHPSKAERRAVQ